MSRCLFFLVLACNIGYGFPKAIIDSDGHVLINYQIGVKNVVAKINEQTGATIWQRPIWKSKIWKPHSSNYGPTFHFGPVVSDGLYIVYNWKVAYLAKFQSLYGTYKKIQYFNYHSSSAPGVLLPDNSIARFAVKDNKGFLSRTYPDGSELFRSFKIKQLPNKDSRSTGGSMVKLGKTLVGVSDLVHYPKGSNQISSRNIHVTFTDPEFKSQKTTSFKWLDGRNVSSRPDVSKNRLLVSGSASSNKSCGQFCGALAVFDNTQKLLWKKIYSKGSYYPAIFTGNNKIAFSKGEWDPSDRKLKIKVLLVDQKDGKVIKNFQLKDKYHFFRRLLDVGGGFFYIGVDGLTTIFGRTDYDGTSLWHRRIN